LANDEVEDLERYLDVTRGEILFARGVMLVEGDAERFLIPPLARALGHDLDQLGITVCSIAGTNFAPYAKLLCPSGLAIPFVIITDLDPMPSGDSLGEKRVIELVKLISTEEETRGKKPAEFLKLAPQKGIFLGEHTLEIDLFKCGRHKTMCETLEKLSDSRAVSDRAKAWADNPASLDTKQFLKDVEAIGKGRFAQTYARRIKKPICPAYIKSAVERIASLCG
jgi:putative ATP-dependent endonuclease of OLD family